MEDVDCRWGGRLIISIDPSGDAIRIAVRDPCPVNVVRVDTDLVWRAFTVPQSRFPSPCLLLRVAFLFRLRADLVGHLPMRGSNLVREAIGRPGTIVDLD